MKTGDKVVCVDDDWSKSFDDPRKHMSHVPKRGSVYVVARWETAKNGHPGICLIGVEPLFGPFVCFYARRFRLLSELKQEAKNNVGLTNEAVKYCRYCPDAVGNKGANVGSVCYHPSTDGTADCKECGIKANEFQNYFKNLSAERKQLEKEYLKELEKEYLKEQGKIDFNG